MQKISKYLWTSLKVILSLSTTGILLLSMRYLYFADYPAAIGYTLLGIALIFVNDTPKEKVKDQRQADALSMSERALADIYIHAQDEDVRREYAREALNKLKKMKEVK